MNTVIARRFPIRSSYQSPYQARIQLIACVLILIAYIVAMTGCGKNEDSQPQQDVYAVTPLSEQMRACASGATYEGQAWATTTYDQLNVQPYDAGQGCGPGAQSMCDGQYGLVCVPTVYLQNQNIAWWSQTQNGFGFDGYSAYVPMQYPAQHPAQYPTQYPRSHSGPRSHGFDARAQMGMTCQVGHHGCGPAAHCRPLAHGHSLGVCAQ